jgi:hypothetical protein
MAVKQPDTKRLQHPGAAVHRRRVAQAKHDGVHLWARHDGPEQLARPATGEVRRATGCFRHEIKPRRQRHFGISGSIFAHKKRGRNTPSNRRMYRGLLLPQVGSKTADGIEKATPAVTHRKACGVERWMSAMQAQGYGPGRLH